MILILKIKKSKDSFIDDSNTQEYLSDSSYSSSSSVSSEDDESYENENENKNYTVYSSNKKTKPKNKNTKEKIISLEEENEIDDKKDIENQNIQSNLKLERIKKSLTQSEQDILAEIGIKQIKTSNDPSKLTLRERLALRVAKGNLGTLQKNENKTPIKQKINQNINYQKDLDIKEVEEILDNNFLGKKTKPSTQKSASDKKDGKVSTKKKKIIEDSEDLDDEEFKI